jgi:hypothetical protein
MNSLKLKIQLGEIISAVSEGGTRYLVLLPAPSLWHKMPEDYTLAEFCSRFALPGCRRRPAAIDDIWPVVRTQTALWFNVPAQSLTLQTVFRQIAR